MRTENILSADILDLIFEHRNKNYGAYTLRKYYNNRLAKSLLLVFVFAAGILMVPKLFKEEKKIPPIVSDIYVVKILPDVVLEAPKPAAKPIVKPPSMKKAAMQQWVNNIVITADPAKASKLISNLDSVAIGNLTVAGPITGLPGGKDPIGTTIGSLAPAPPAPVDIETPRYTADIMPSFPGGIEALMKFLKRHLNNPSDLEDGAMVSVKIRFVVGYDGMLKSFQVIEDGGDEFNNEVLRVLKKMPQWIPGKANGEKVSVYYTIPVKFTAGE